MTTNAASPSRFPLSNGPAMPAEENAKRFAIRNAVNEAQEAIVNYRWIDPKTGRKVGGLVMFGVLMTLAKHCWDEIAVCKPDLKTVAYSVGLGRSYVRVALRAAVNAGIIFPVNQTSKRGTHRYCMGVDLIEHFLYRASRPLPELLGDCVCETEFDVTHSAAMSLSSGGREFGCQTT